MEFDVSKIFFFLLIHLTEGNLIRNIMEEAPKINLKINKDNPKEDILKILQHIRPQWNAEIIEFKEFTEGKMNIQICCSDASDPEDAVMFRIHKPEMRGFIDRKKEVQHVQVLHKTGFAPKVLALFENGFCYQFFHGITLTRVAIKQEPVYRYVAKGLARIHSTKIAESSSANYLFPTLKALISILPEELPNPRQNTEFKASFPGKDALRQEIQLLEEHLLPLKSPIVLCHGDPRPENVIWSDKKGRVMFIDFEFSRYNYQAFDITSHFCYFGGLDQVDMSLCPDKEFQKKWLKVYLKEFYEANGRSADEVTQKDVELLYTQVNKFSLVSHLMHYVTGIMGSISSSFEFNILSYGICRLQEYFKKKDVILSLIAPN